MYLVYHMLLSFANLVAFFLSVIVESVDSNHGVLVMSSLAFSPVSSLYSLHHVSMSVNLSEDLCCHDWCFDRCSTAQNFFPGIGEGRI